MPEVKDGVKGDHEGSAWVLIGALLAAMCIVGFCLLTGIHR